MPSLAGGLSPMHLIIGNWQALQSDGEMGVDVCGHERV